MHSSVFCNSSKKDLALSIITDSATSFPSECITVNHLYNTKSNCANLGCFNACCLKRHFTLSTDVKVFYLIDSWQSHDVSSHNHTSAFTTFKPPNNFKFLNNYLRSMFPLVSIPCLLILRSFEDITIAWQASWSPGHKI